MQERFEPTMPNLEAREQEISPERILEMSPQELVEHFTELEKQGRLESFLEKAAENDSLVAMFSYWEKWLTKDHRELVDKMVEEKKKMYPEDSESLPLNLEKKFTPEELELIFKNLGAIQLTFGCSKACPFCGLDAVPGVREHMPYSQLANLFQKHGKSIGKNHPFLYWASEPSDYASKEGLDDKTYEDVHQLAIEYAGYEPHVTSRETTNKEWLNFLNIGKINGARVSLYGLSEADASKVDEFGYIEKVGKAEEHKKGLGKSSVKYTTELKSGIGCFDGGAINAAWVI